MPEAQSITGAAWRVRRIRQYADEIEGEIERIQQGRIVDITILRYHALEKMSVASIKDKLDALGDDWRRTVSQIKYTIYGKKR